MEFKSYCLKVHVLFSSLLYCSTFERLSREGNDGDVMRLKTVQLPLKWLFHMLP